MTANLTWIEGEPPRRRGKYDEIANALMEKPGVWAKLPVASKSAATTLRNRGFEVRTVGSLTGDGVGQAEAIYARLPEEAAA